MLADPNFGCPGRIDLLLGVDIYTDVLLHGRQCGPPGSPVAFETIFGWVLAGRTHFNPTSHIATHHVSTTLNDDDVLHRFWEIEELILNEDSLTLEERSVLNHFKETHQQTRGGRFVVPLPRRYSARPLGESPLGDSWL